MALVYHLTAAGKDALWAKSGGTDLPVEYRRLLALMEFEGHIDVIRGRLRRFPDRLIEEWLSELVELKMIEPRHAAGKGPDITFNGSRVPRLPPLADEDSQRLARSGATVQQKKNRSVLTSRPARSRAVRSCAGP